MKWWEDETQQPEGLIGVLLDKTAPFADRDDAAKDLFKYDEKEAEAALATVGSDRGEDEELADSCGQSLAEIWLRRGQVNREIFARLTEPARRIALRLLERFGTPPMSVQGAIVEAERLLPGVAAPEGETDPRWQTIIHLSFFIESDAETLWPFIQRWGCHDDQDLRYAIATCLLEDLLERRFSEFFPRVEELVRANPLFADTFLMCWKFGQAEEPENAALFDRLQEEVRRTTG